MSDPEMSASILVECPWAAAGSDVGMKRADNEDALLCDPVRGLFAVADGMGGHAAGEQASAAAIRTLNAELTAGRLRAAAAEGDEAVCALFREALEAANDAVLRVGEEHPEWQGLGTTIVLALLEGDRLYVANVGDSRAYLLHKSKAVVLTRDHSVAAMLAETQELTPAELREHPLRNRLTMVLGADEEPLDPAFTACSVLPGERLVLCTDGLWEMLDDTEIAQIAHFSATPREAVYSLIATADDFGADDNITAIVIFR